MPVSLRIISVMNIAAVSQRQILAMRCNKKVMVLCSFHCLLHQVGVVQVLPDFAGYGLRRISLADGDGHGDLHFIAELLNRLPYPF